MLLMFNHHLCGGWRLICTIGQFLGVNIPALADCKVESFKLQRWVLTWLKLRAWGQVKQAASPIKYGLLSEPLAWKVGSSTLCPKDGEEMKQLFMPDLRVGWMKSAL